MMEVRDLTVRFGGVTPLDNVSLEFPKTTCGLIGPNGAGKTTFFNVLSGFAKSTAGTVRAFDADLLAMPGYRRARWGLRRTFQTAQAIRQLTVADNVALALEHAGPRTDRTAFSVGEALEFVGLATRARHKVQTLAATELRLVEIARAVVGTPRLVLLDEPAAGLPDEETAYLSSVIRRIPLERDALVVLVDHDMSLVSACCELVAVLDFGKLVAIGRTQAVLADDNVMRAYLGTGEVLT